MKRAKGIVAAMVLAWSGRADAQSDRELATRQELLARAGELSEEGKHADALELAKRAAAIRMTPSLRMFLAGEQAALGLVAEAYGNGRQCAVEAGADMGLRDRDRILARCSELEASLGKRVGRVTVKLPIPAPPGVHVVVAGEEIHAALVGTPYVVTPGKLSVVVIAAGYLPFNSDIDVAEGGAVDVNVELASDPNVQPCFAGQERVHGACLAVCARGRTRTKDGAARCCWAGQAWNAVASACAGAPQCPPGLAAQREDCIVKQGEVATARSSGSPGRMLVPMVLGGAGVAVAAIGTGFYVDGGSKYSALKTLCATVPPGCTTPAYDSASSMIQRDSGLGIGGWIVGGALIAAGAVWYLAPTRKDASPPHASARLVIDPFARSAGLAGSF